MGLFDFMKNAGEKLFPSAQAQPANGNGTGAAANSAPAQAAPDVAALNDRAGKAILEYIRQKGLATDGLQIRFDGATSTATVTGEAPDQQTREKIVLCAGNVSSVERVDDQMTVATPAEESRFYTVKSGDTLSKISKEMYGDANKYNAIFEANKPMLEDPNKIYPGQSLRIPAEA